MKIAVPTNDGLSIAEHFGRSVGFLVFHTGNGQITAREIKENTALLSACCARVRRPY